MMHPRMKSKLLASALAAVLAPAAVVSTVVAPATAQAAPVQEASCQVHAVLASKDGDGTIPKNLEFLRGHLEQDEFAAYKSFLLVEQKALEIKLDKKSEVTFRSGNRLGLRLLGNDDTRLKLHASLSGRDGKKSLLNADYSIEDRGVMMIAAGKSELEGKLGKLFFAIQCARGG